MDFQALVPADSGNVELFELRGLRLLLNRTVTHVQHTLSCAALKVSCFVFRRVF